MALTLCLDFDGVLHDHHNIPDGNKMGPPIDGALEAVRELSRRYSLVILTARRPPYEYVSQWLKYYGFPDMRITNVKGPAVAYIDDHGLHFQSWGQALKDLRRLEPYLTKGYLEDAKYR